jgi:hypothetical protein
MPTAFRKVWSATFLAALDSIDSKYWQLGGGGTESTARSGLGRDAASLQATDRMSGLHPDRMGITFQAW